MKPISLGAAGRTIFLVGGLLANLAHGCVMTPTRHQHVWLQSLAPAATARLPVERVAQRGDLIALLVPSGTRVQQVSAENQAIAIAVPIASRDYVRLAEQSGGRISTEVRDTTIAKAGQWLYFVADKPGLAYLRLTRNQKSALIRLTVELEKIVPRGRTFRANETLQSQALEIGPDDLLELSLPGRLAEPWTLTLEDGLARLLSLQASESGEAERVTLSMKPAPATAEGLLTVGQGTRRYQFILRRLAVPKC